MTFGEKLYDLRKKHNLSQEQLAEALNVSRQSISKWEGNVTYPESEKLIAISDFFRISLDYLMKPDASDEMVERRTNKLMQQTPMLAGFTLCLGGVIGLLVLCLISWLMPDSAEQMGASSIIKLNGTALLVLLFVGLLVLGVALIIRLVRKMNDRRDR